MVVPVLFAVLGGISCMRSVEYTARTNVTNEVHRGMEKYEYQCWEGGPRIVLPQSLEASWKGHEMAFNPLDPSTDYGRACAISGDFGLISVGEGHALVLAGSPPMVAWSPFSTADEIDIVILKEWSDEDLDALVDATVENADLQATNQTWAIKDDTLGLYYAGDAPQEPMAAGKIAIPCSRGSYALWTYTFSDPGLGEVFMIRMIREQPEVTTKAGT
jgi:hypothetical protein